MRFVCKPGSFGLIGSSIFETDESNSDYSSTLEAGHPLSKMVSRCIYGLTEHTQKEKYKPKLSYDTCPTLLFHFYSIYVYLSLKNKGIYGSINNL